MNESIPPKKVYVGMALTTAPVDFRESFQVELKNELRSRPNVCVLDFYWVAKSENGGTDSDVYEWDKTRTQEADLFVAIVDHPSIGLGMEIMIRHATGKPMLFFAKEGQKVTRMLLGFLEKNDIKLHRYVSVSDIVNLVQENV